MIDDFNTKANKEKKKSINDINNPRPISISNSLSQIFERLLLKFI